MSLMQAVSNVFKNYANFKGRARRSEYWYFYLFNALVPIVIWILSAIIIAASGEEAGLFIAPAIILLYSLATIIPSLAVTCRRLHDVGKSGAYMFFFLLPFVGAILVWVWAFQDGQPWTNQYGEDPKGRNLSPYSGAYGDPSVTPYPDIPSKPKPSTEPSKKSCPHCERKVDADAEFCPYCGENTRKKPVVESVIHKKSCANCGAMIERGAKFCPNCGHNADEIPGGFSVPSDLG